jgi:HD-GYP domain-containing protein (c-di-GMP phosphodiesterase class II)
MKLIRKETVSAQSPESGREPPWKILVVDDEPDVRQLTALNLRDFQFENRRLELIEAGSAAEARARLEEHADIAIALIDVVMETDDAGLRLVEAIRKELRNEMMRLVIRTGQPGVAPERYVIDHFDIDDYKDKTELTAQKLYTTVRSALKSYRDLNRLELNRQGLSRVLEVTPQLYQMRCETLSEFFRGVLTQIIGLCRLGHSGFISTIDGLLLTQEGEEVCLQAGVGEFDDPDANRERIQEVIRMCGSSVIGQNMQDGLRSDAMIAPLRVGDRLLGYVYLESATRLSEAEREMILIMADQCASALENMRLNMSLEESYDHVIGMLAMVAEYKDTATGAHIRRIAEYTRRIALEMGIDEEEAEAWGKASRLHDVGKVGIADAILRKPGRLTPEEYEVIKTHCEIGGAILNHDPSLALARAIALCHHERWDGQGYPRGIAGENIPLPARIAAVADVFDALISPRPYKEPWRIEDAMAEIEKEAGARYDPRVVRAAANLYERGELAEIMRINGLA